MTKANTQKSLRLYARLQTYAWQFKGWFAFSIFGFLIFAFAQAAFVKLIEFFIAELNTEKTNTVLAFLPAELTSSLMFVPAAVVVSAAGATSQNQEKIWLPIKGKIQRRRIGLG